MKKYYFLILFLSINLSFSQGYLRPTDESVADFESYSKEGFGFADDIPIRKSLEKYVPPVGSQRDTGSCVAWATTYYNLSTIYNMTFGITSYRDKAAHSFDPWFTYSFVNRFANQSSDCDDGLFVSDAFKFLTNIGGKKLFLPPYDMSCNYSISESNFDVIQRFLNPYKISKIEKEIAYDWDPYNYPLSQDIVNKVKTEIGKYSYPVVAGFTNYSSSTLYNVGSSGIWYPRYTKGSGGHAMTIVGYDDTFNGGSFRIVNSWGRDWGDDGYAWIRYSDFRRFCDSVFFTWLSKNIDSEMNQIRNIDGYTRQYANNKTRIYEGERNTDGFSGYGIVTFIDSDSHFAGWFEGGSMNGTFRVINSNGYYQIEYENGTPVDTEKLGFAASQESLKKLEETNEYISQMFPSLRFKQGGEESEEFKETID